ncbi:DUF1501 domain-containing protein [Terricaulis sp.]|uniref:DUF1501 domain-containing protein n=1 Tax=Terricaulis sp. TaxID=2768686 RepID=UPI003782E6DA
MLNRRHLLACGAGAAALSFPAFAFGQAQATSKRLLVVILRGGMDGLSALPPVGDPNYASLRGRLALPRVGDGAVLPLDSTFALHKNLAKFAAMYRAGELLPIHACATAYRERSHFDAQNVLETGAGAPFARSEGWLNRSLGALPQARPEMGIALSAQAPLILRGPANVSTWSPSALPDVENDTMARLLALYRSTDPALAGALDSAMSANSVAMESGAGDMNARGYRIAPLAQIAARFLKDEHGPIAAVMEMGNWDTHANQGLEQGPLARNLAALDEGLDAFKTEMGPAWRDTAVIIVTEFGRTAAPNGANGTDHGMGAAAFLAGGSVNGGRVLADWPGLAQSALYEGRDLRPTTDLRGVFKGVLADHLRVPTAALERDGFPESGGVRVVQGLIRG